MFGLGAGELFLIFVIALLFLGPKKLPDLARGLGQAIREFQKARDEMMSEVNKPHAPNTVASKESDVLGSVVKVQNEEEATAPENKPESPKHS